MKNILYNIAKELQITMENKFVKGTAGACYLYGHCLKEIFESLGFQSRKTTGKLAILMKNGQSRYITYGRLPLKGKQVGIYHTWCEVIIDNETFIVDPSLKSNLNFIEKVAGIKITPMVEKDTLVTNVSKTYYYKYFENDTLKSLSNESLASYVSQKQIDDIIGITLERIQSLTIKKSA